MSTNYARPKWWQLYLALPLLIALFMADNRLKLSEYGHQVVQIGIVLFIYGLFHLWLKANAKALSNMDQQQLQRTATVIRIPSYQLADAKINRPMFQVSDMEIKGTLSDTFEMEITDAEFLPLNEAIQELNKE